MRALSLLALVVVPLAGPARADKAACITAHEAGQAERKAGHLRAARASFYTCAAEACPGPVKADCSRWLGEVEGAIPSVVVRVLDEAGKDPPSTTTLALDGAEVPRDGLPIRLDPGKHTVVARRADGVTRTATFVLVEGEHDRVVTLTYEAPRPVARRSVAPWVLAAVGVVGLAGFTVVGLTTNARLRELEDSCAPRCDPAEKDAVARRYLVGDVLLGVGVVAVGAAVTVYVLDRPSTVTVSPARGGAYATLRFVF